ncbi:MAG: DNA polymerase III subunit delta [Campylobacter sp.]|uniref:DNA polymerase III subunit delta n=1 Tax=Campylobacter sp. TaxID=205 RepID=UPI001B679FCF|nr:DNA polymerase III subunit delta [Campylobacter sp.]MBP3676074.1 DNA polymerase III subunit delta [Campylobacter sp.]
MYKKDFISLLNSPNIPNFFLLYGAESYQVEFYTNELLGKFDKENMLSLYFDDYSFNLAMSHLSEPSLFANSNLLHIKNDKKIPAKDAKELIAQCQNNPNNIFILELHEGDDKALTDIKKQFGSNFVRFFPPSSASEVNQILSNHAKFLGLNIDNQSLLYIYNLQNENLYLSASELNKLASIGIKFSLDEIKERVYALNGISFDVLFDKIINKKNINSDYFEFINDSSFNEIALLNMLFRAFHRLYLIHSSIKTSGKFDPKTVLGYTPPPQIINKLQSQAISIKTEQYTQIFKFLNEIEFDLKCKNNIDKECYLLSAILSLQDILSKNSKF